MRSPGGRQTTTLIFLSSAGNVIVAFFTPCPAARKCLVKPPFPILLEKLESTDVCLNPTRFSLRDSHGGRATPQSRLEHFASK